MIYGYARVSTDGQSVAAQVKQLREAGARWRGNACRDREKLQRQRLDDFEVMSMNPHLGKLTASSL